ncbi:MAG: LLM class flavin-dependent oxidoreductase, partial [Pseudomonadota bacterium]
QSLFVDLTDDPDTAPSEIFLGYRLGRRALIDHLDGLEAMGVNHVAINLRHSTRPAAEVVEELSLEVLPHFAAHEGDDR